jgi:phosphoglycolate phosphatase
LKPAIKGILFDKDGTLLDYHASWTPINVRAAEFAAGGDRQLAAHLLQAGGHDVATHRVASGSLLAAGSTTEIAQGWIDAGSKIPLESLTASVDQIFRDGVATVVPVLDLAAFFKRLKAHGLALGIASSDSEQAIHLTVARFGFAADVDFIAGYDSGFGSKPAPGMLTAFARHTGLTASSIAVVGDNLHDMEMAENGGAGLRIAVLTGTSSRAELTPVSDLCLDSVGNLEAALFGG